MVTSLERRWFAIQTTAGHENKVKSLIERHINADPTPEEERLISQALVPIQQVVEIKNGKKVTVDRKVFPGYVLVEMVMNQTTLHAVNNVQGVIKFVGQGWTPQPLRQDEVNRLLGVEDVVDDQVAKEDIPFMIGQVVEISEGPFSEFSGTVEEVLQTVERYNKRDAEGATRVRIHAVGFPTIFMVPGVGEKSGARFANLMRVLTKDNDGSFVGLNNIRP